MGEKKAYPLPSISLAVAAAIFVFFDFKWCSQVTSNGGYAGLLLTSSLWFMLVGALIGVQSHPDGGQPPTLVVLAAIALEGAKTTLLARLVYSGPDQYVKLSRTSLGLAF